jgi:hypothetical protein
VIEVAQPIELEPLSHDDAMFIAVCYEYLGNGRFTSEQRVMGFARAIQRRLAEQNDMKLAEK